MEFGAHMGPINTFISDSSMVKSQADERARWSWHSIFHFSERVSDPLVYIRLRFSNNFLFSAGFIFQSHHQHHHDQVSTCVHTARLNR